MINFIENKEHNNILVREKGTKFKLRENFIWIKVKIEKETLIEILYSFESCLFIEFSLEYICRKFINKKTSDILEVIESFVKKGSSLSYFEELSDAFLVKEKKEKFTFILNSIKESIIKHQD